MADELTERIIGAAIEVHRLLGSGLLESIYEEALCHEFALQNISFQRQIAVLKATNLKRGLIINFGAPRLIDGIKRISL